MGGAGPLIGRSNDRKIKSKNDRQRQEQYQQQRTGVCALHVRSPQRVGLAEKSPTRRGDVAYCGGATANEVQYAFPSGGIGMGELGLAVKSPVV